MKFWNHLLASLVLTMLPAPLLACFCGNSLRFCQALPETGNADHVVFVGKVTQIYPKSWADMMEEFARTHRDLLESLRAQSADTSGRRLAGSPSADLTEWRKQIIEYFWGDTLTPTAREQLRTADQRELERLGFDQHHRVHLEVVENFAGAEAGEFTLYTAFDGSACGFDFAEGETYLVEAYRKVATGTWEVSSCSRTRLLAEATEDLEVLRAWKTGQRLPGRISGQIIELEGVIGPGEGRRSPPSGTPFRIRLLGGKEILETTSDSRGQFTFENLDPGVYEVELGQVPALSRPADLTRAWCAMVTLSIRR